MVYSVHNYKDDQQRSMLSCHVIFPNSDRQVDWVKAFQNSTFHIEEGDGEVLEIMGSVHISVLATYQPHLTLLMSDMGVTFDEESSELFDNDDDEESE